MLRRRQALAALIIIATCLPASPGQAEEKCSVCHPQEVANYLKTGMGRSISTPGNQPSGAFEHPVSGSRFSVVSTGESMTQRVERDGLSAEYPAEYVIGSGNAAFGYLIRVGNDVFQSPVAYYTKRQRWDMAPGMESHPAPDFDRPVLAECLWCHADRPQPVPATQSQYSDPILMGGAISCARCHGPAERHLAGPFRGDDRQPRQAPPASARQRL